MNSARLPLNVLIRRHLTQTGVRGFFTSPKVPLNNLPVSGNVGGSVEVSNISMDGVEAAPHFQADTSPLMENDDPLKQRIFLFRPTWIQKRLAPVKGLARWVSTYWAPRQLTEQELEEKKLNAERKRLDSLLRTQAQDAKVLIVNCLTRLNYCYRPEKGRTQEVVFDLVTYSEIAIYLHVDAGKLPRGVSILSIASEVVCTDLSASVRHPVRANIERVEDAVIGLTYVVELAATFGIPDHVKFSDLLKMLPEGYPALSFPVGLTENKRPAFRSLESWPHGIVCGQTLGGKSNMQNVIICSIIARATPEDVTIFLVDLKGGGIEYGNYVGVPHLGRIDGVPTGIGRNVADALIILEWVCKESARRQQLFTGQQAQGSVIKNLDEWNRAHKIRRMPKILVAVDELALLLDPDDKPARTRALRLLREISATARAAGVYLLVATQSSDKYIFNNSVKTNFPGRIAFSFPDYSGSLLAVNDGSAINLMPAGRAIYKNGTDKFLVQTPLITNADIMTIVTNARAGRTTVEMKETGVTAQEIVEWAIAENNGLMGRRAIQERFAGRMEARAIQDLMKTMFDKVYTVGEYDYTVKRGGPRQPSLVVRVMDDEAQPNTPPVEPDSRSVPYSINTVSEFRDSLRASLDAWEVEYKAETFTGDGIDMPLDLFLFDPGHRRKWREEGLIKDLQAICSRFNAAPTDGAFILEGERVVL